MSKQDPTLTVDQQNQYIAEVVRDSRRPAPRAELGSLQRFSCHKVVRAARVTGIRRDEADGHPTTLEFGDIGLEWPVLPEWIKRHDPHIGGFFVVYDDGHTSFSPSHAFLAGYTAIRS